MSLITETTSPTTSSTTNLKSSSQTITAATSATTPFCIDFPTNFKDSSGYDCADYATKQWCTSSGGFGSGWMSDWGTFADHSNKDGIDATTACCACHFNDPQTASLTRTERPTYSTLSIDSTVILRFQAAISDIDSMFLSATYVRVIKLLCQDDFAGYASRPYCLSSMKGVLRGAPSAVHRQRRSTINTVDVPIAVVNREGALGDVPSAHVVGGIARAAMPSTGLVDGFPKPLIGAKAADGSYTYTPEPADELIPRPETTLKPISDTGSSSGIYTGIAVGTVVVFMFVVAGVVIKRRSSSRKDRQKIGLKARLFQNTTTTVHLGVKPGPDNWAPAIGTISPGEYVSVLEIWGEWCKIEGKDGWGDAKLKYAWAKMTAIDPATGVTRLVLTEAPDATSYFPLPRGGVSPIWSPGNSSAVAHGSSPGAVSSVLYFDPVNEHRWSAESHEYMDPQPLDTFGEGEGYINVADGATKTLNWAIQETPIDVGYFEAGVPVSCRESMLSAEALHRRKAINNRFGTHSLGLPMPSEWQRSVTNNDISFGYSPRSGLSSSNSTARPDSGWSTQPGTGGINDSGWSESALAIEHLLGELRTAGSRSMGSAVAQRGPSTKDVVTTTPLPQSTTKALCARASVGELRQALSETW